MGILKSGDCVVPVSYEPSDLEGFKKTISFQPRVKTSWR